MCLFWCRALPVMTVLVCLSPGQPPKPPASAETSITGVFIGRSGKPMANARLFLARVEGDQEELEAKVILTTLGPAQTDAQGQFRFKGFAPGKYTIVYYPAGGASIAPAQFSVKALAAVTRSILPLMKNVEIGTSEPLQERGWGPTLRLLKGHTFWGQGANMRVWNATLRRGTAGPYLEVRKGQVWQGNFTDKGQVRMDAWGF